MLSYKKMSESTDYEPVRQFRYLLRLSVIFVFRREFRQEVESREQTRQEAIYHVQPSLQEARACEQSRQKAKIGGLVDLLWNECVLIWSSWLFTLCRYTAINNELVVTKIKKKKKRFPFMRK